jgi:RNA polymerase sigma factor (sigma-70 family)
MKEVYERYYLQLVYFGCKLISDRQAVEDIVVDCIVNFIQHGYAPHLTRRILYACVKNKCINHTRSQETHDKINTKLFDEEYVELQVVESRLIGLLTEAIYTLPKDCRDVIIMYYLEEKKCVDIARLLNKTPSTVRSLKKYGLNKLVNLKQIMREAKN